MVDQFFRFRLDPDMRRLFNRLRDEKDINLSRWVQRQIRNALQREFPDHEATETPKTLPIATTETREPEPPQTPTIRTRKVPEPHHATTKTPKEPPIATTETREHEPPQTPTIRTREVPEPEHATTETPKEPPIATTETREHEPPQTPTIRTREVPEPEQLPPLELPATTETPEAEPEQLPPLPEDQEPDPQKPPIKGWKPRKLPSGEWGAALEGEMVAELPDNDQLPGTTIVMEPNNRDPWTTTIENVVSRTDSSIVVSRPDATRGRRGRSQSDA